MSKITKYPIILVHGVIIKDFKFFRAFGRIEKVLTSSGFKVYTAPIDGVGTSETNAYQLKEYINQILKKENVDKVNLIAHSKGGLDSKYFIENLNNDDVVASLTTLCTPFKGSPIASIILKLPSWMTKVIAWCVDLIYKIFGDQNPNSLQVCSDLKLVDDLNNECLKISKDVFVQSYSTIMERSKDDFVMGIPLAFSRYFYKNKTDGLVPLESTLIGEYKGLAFNESISHTEIVDFMVKKKKRDKIHNFYLMIVNDLIEKGY